MSKDRIAPEAGFVNTGKLPRGPQGRALCRECGQEVPRGRRSFCSDGCVDAWKWKTDPGFVRRKVFERDRGICADCGLDCQLLAGALAGLRELTTLGWHGNPRADITPEIKAITAKLNCPGRTTLWDADHVVPVAQGGGGCGLDNYQTLCVWCHRDKTARQRGAVQA